MNPSCQKCTDPVIQLKTSMVNLTVHQGMQPINAAEAAHERHMAAFHDGGAIAWKTLLQQEQEARKLK